MEKPMTIHYRMSAPAAAFIALLIMFTGGGSLFGQQPRFPVQPPAAPAAPGGPAGGAPAGGAPARAGALPGAFEKLHFAVFDMYSFRTHPFFQLTQVTGFSESHAATGGSGDMGTPASDAESGFFDQALHSLPPFGVEFGWGTEVLFPRSISLGVDYARFHEMDSDAILKQPELVGGGVLDRFEMDTYYYAAVARFYGLDASEPGINYFIGFSLGVIEGNMLVRSFNPSVPHQYIHFYAAPVGASRLGVDVSGEVFGGRFEMILINAREVEFESNPFPDQSDNTTINFVGSIIRLSAYYRFQ